MSNAAPVGYIPIKLVEKAPLVYFLMTGILFMAVPQTLDAHVYDPWKYLSTPKWGVIVLLFCAIHSMALWWNGRSQMMSRISRSIALMGYLTISFYWGLYFILSEAYWGINLFWGLLPILCLSLFSHLVGEIKYFGVTKE